MHIHILGICGTFMGGVAALAKAAGHFVTGSDANVYPPMSTQLRDLGIEVFKGYEPQQFATRPDYVVVGNALSRGNPAVEAMLDQGLQYCSGPQWLAEHVLHNRHVIAVTGTHGKTTTASMLAWILQDAGLSPGFLIGGVPANFMQTASAGESEYFVVEADEYDTAFFDKRAKFVHYRARSVVINNIEFDHADIYDDLEDIYWQFHQLMRTVPSNGRIVINGDDPRVAKIIGQGCWTPVETFSRQDRSDWFGSYADSAERRIRISHRDSESAEASWQLGGMHNLENALAAVAAAQSAGVALAGAVKSLSGFQGVKRRMERTATVSDIAIYDDFAHHPTAIRQTIAALRKRFPGQRVVVALEPRSNTMKMGVHNETLAASLRDADLVFVYRPEDMDEYFDESLATLGSKVTIMNDFDDLVAGIDRRLLPGDQLVFMSNGSFGSARQKLTMLLQGKRRS